MRTVVVQQPQQSIVQPVYTPVVFDTSRPIIRTISSNILVSSVILDISYEYSVKRIVKKQNSNKFKIFRFRWCVIYKPILLAPVNFSIIEIYCECLLIISYFSRNLCQLMWLACSHHQL